MKAKVSKTDKWTDHYALKARKDGYPARSVYKLQEIQEKYRIIRKGDKVLDLGCAPGSWLLYAAKITGESGQVAGIDLNPVTIALPAHVQTFTADLREPDLSACPLNTTYHAVISDMAPATTGSKHVDALRSIALCEMALYIATETLIKDGVFVCKIFQGEGFQEFLAKVRSLFSKQKNFKPASCRKASRELFIIGTGKK